MKKILKYLMFSAVFCAVLFIIPHFNKIYADSQIYFDEDGNFVFATYDKKATGKIRYKTVGWLIKKYEGDRGNPGQIYGIISKPEFYYAVEDKENPGYRYSYFIVKKEEVMGAIGKASSSWEKYLEQYGGVIYLDSVMTVTEYDNDTGGLMADGSAWGEVYYDYAGISAARWWARPEYLLEYFDIPIVFPKSTLHIKPEYEEKSPVTRYISEDIIVSATIGSHDISLTEYDIGKGIPAGEDLFAYGTAAKYYSEGILIKRSGTVKIPTKVTTDYLLKWTDAGGMARSETVRVERWYHVAKDYEYYEVSSFEQYKLTKAKIEGTAAGCTEERIDVPDRNIEIVNYKERDKHISIKEGNYYAGIVAINSKNNQKPDIPEENQQALAEKGNASCKSRNDRLEVGSSIILSDEWSEGCNYTEKTIKAGKTSFYRTNIIIDSNVQNGVYEDTRVSYVYESVYKNNWTGKEPNSQKLKIISQNVEKIAVHTPVLCNAKVSSPKKYNMAVAPEGNQIVLGTDFQIKAGAVGYHRDIRGYGYGDYEKYAKKMYVSFPFEIIIGSELYAAGEWIEFNSDNVICKLPDNVRTGDYTVKLVVFSINAPKDRLEDVLKNHADCIGKGANLSITQYAAQSSLEVEVIGTLYGFGVNQQGENMHYVGRKIGFDKMVPEGTEVLPMNQGEKCNYELTVMSRGFGKSEYDKICAKIKYYYISDGNREEIDLYMDKKHDLLTGNVLEKAPDEIVWTKEGSMDGSSNQYMWKTNMELGESIVAVKKGTEIKWNEDIDGYVLRGDNILINFEIYGYCGKTAELTYNNVENYKKGYCNMWKTEGYKYEFTDKTGNKIRLMDGDALFLDVSGKIYQDYEVIGTH